MKTLNVSFFLLSVKKSLQTVNASDAWIPSYLLLTLPSVLTQIVFKSINLMDSVINAKALLLKISKEFVLLWTQIVNKNKIKSVLSAKKISFPTI
jgi:hypothetical protein